MLHVRSARRDGGHDVRSLLLLLRKRRLDLGAVLRGFACRKVELFGVTGDVRFCTRFRPRLVPLLAHQTYQRARDLVSTAHRRVGLGHALALGEERLEPAPKGGGELALAAAGAAPAHER